MSFLGLQEPLRCYCYFSSMLAVLVLASLLSANNFSKSIPLNFESSVLLDAWARNSSFKNPSSFVNVLTFSSKTEFSFLSWLTRFSVSWVFCFDLTLLRFTAWNYIELEHTVRGLTNTEIPNCCGPFFSDIHRNLHLIRWSLSV